MEVGGRGWQPRAVLEGWGGVQTPPGCERASTHQLRSPRAPPALGRLRIAHPGGPSSVLLPSMQLGLHWGILGP